MARSTSKNSSKAAAAASSMKRVPVTKASYKKISKTGEQRSHSPKGVPGSGVKVGKPDKEKTDAARFASYLGWGGFGMGMGRPNMIGSTSGFYNSTYMNGGRVGAFGDVPPGIALLMEQNGGVIYYPSTLKERYQYYRWFYISDPYVRAAVDLNTDLPMSRLQLRMPKMNDKAMAKRILHFYQDMVDDLKLFDKLHSILFEINIIGNAMAFVEYDEKKKRWGRIVLLPPEEVNVANYPLSDVKRIQYRPEILNATIRKYSLDTSSYESYLESVKALPDEDQDIIRDVSYELVKQIQDHNGVLEFDSDPYSGDGNDKIGSFVHHFANKRHDYQDLGVSPLECVMQPLLQKTHYKYTQTTLASRNMTPRDLIMADGIPPAALDDLRLQVDESMLSPDFKIVTNYNVQWEQIGAENRLIDLAREYETIENELFAGLGVSRELLTGEGMYSGSHITVEIMNTKYLIVREMLQRFVEESLFKPVALQNGFYHDDEDGFRTWYYPRLSFTRLTIRDNQEVFDQLFQLYQKGSLPIGMILDIFNINSDDVNEELERDLFTVRDATFNEMLRQMYSSMGDQIVENTDLIKQVAESLRGPMGRKLQYHGEDAETTAAPDSDDLDDEDDLDLLGGDEGGGEESDGSGEDNGLSWKPPSAPGESGESGEQVGDSGEEPASAKVEEYLDGIREESRVDAYMDNIRSEEGVQSSGGTGQSGEVSPEDDAAAEEYLRKIGIGSPSAEGQPAPAGKETDYIRRIREEDAVSGYLESARAEEKASGYLDRVRSEDKAREYLDRVTGEVAGDSAGEYLDRVRDEESDESARKYIESFLGESAKEREYGEDDESAGL